MSPASEHTQNNDGEGQEGSRYPITRNQNGAEADAVGNIAQ